MESILQTIREHGALDYGVLAVGVERAWVSRADVAAFALDALAAGDSRSEVIELAAPEDLDLDRVVHLLRRLADLDKLPSRCSNAALRRWMFGFLESIHNSRESADTKLDRLEDVYAMLGYPEELSECSKYFVPHEDRARGIQVGEVTASPLDAMARVLSQLKRELGVH